MVAVVFEPPVGTVVVVWSVVVDLVVVVRVEREVPDRVLVVPVSYFFIISCQQQSRIREDREWGVVRERTVPRVPVNILVPVVT